MNNLNYQEKFKPLQEGWHDQTQAIFASVEVGWRSMLYLTVTGRNDWASQLAYSKNSSFFYPSVGLSAVVSNMVNMPEWFTFLKVRGSYSKVASAFARYLSNPAYSFNNQTHNWSKPSTYPAYNLKPEDTKSWEIGLNARFLNHINFDVTYYRSNTYHQTIYAPLPSSSGYNQVVVQAGDVQNQGVELALGYNNKWNDFTWSSSYTFTLNRNEIKRLAAGEVNPVTGETITDNEIQKDWLGASNVAPQVILRPGGSMSDIYVNHELKRDLNGNIEIDPSTGNLSIAETDFRKVGQLRLQGHRTRCGPHGPNRRPDLLGHAGRAGLLRRVAGHGRRARPRRHSDQLRHRRSPEVLFGDFDGRGRLRSLLPLQRHQRTPAGAEPAVYAAGAVVPQQSQTDGRIRRQEPLDDLLQGAVRPRNLGGDGQRLLSGRGLLHAAEHAQFRL